MTGKRSPGRQKTEGQLLYFEGLIQACTGTALAPRRVTHLAITSARASRRVSAHRIEPRAKAMVMMSLHGPCHSEITIAACAC